ncbi:TPA: hypothetical protein ACPDKD_000385 [Pasteurella multocida]
MAFTEHTFSLLRESVKQSMLDDKQKGLPTGELLKFKPNTEFMRDVIKNVFVDMRYYNYSGDYSYATDWVSYNLELSDVKLVNGNVTLTVTKKGEKKVTKKGIKLGRALKWVFPEVDDYKIKDKVVEVTSRYATAYVLFTDRYIHKHYRVLAVTQKLTSCMSKKPEFYEIVRPGTDEEDPPWERYIYPTEPYNGSPNLRLALITNHHPDSKEFNEEGQYPFIARAIVKIDEDNINYYRVYGIERASAIFSAVGINKRGTEGGKLNIIYSEYGDIVAPYVDPHNSLSNDGDYLIIDADGDYEIEHNRGILQSKNQGCYCEHCGEYHYGVDEDDYIYVDGLGRVYGGCRDDYDIPIGCGSYYHTDNMRFSDIHDDWVHDDDAVEVIVSTDTYFRTDYIHEGYLSDYDVVKLAVNYTDSYSHALSKLCIETLDGDYYLEDLQDGYYFEYNDDYYDLGDGYWSDAMNCYIPICEAVKHNDDWVTQEYLDGLNEDEELNDAA